MSNPKDQNSFLHEAQKFGKASEEVDTSKLDEAIDSVHVILNENAVKLYHETPEEKWPTSKLIIYCLDCRAPVPAKIVQVRRKSRAVCGICKSKKIAMGNEEGLKKYYHYVSSQKTNVKNKRLTHE